MRVHRVITTCLPMPPKVTGQQGPRLQGGLPPVAWRNAWSRAGETGKTGRVYGERRTAPAPEWVKVSERELSERLKAAARHTIR